MFAAEFEPLQPPSRRRSKRAAVAVETEYESDGMARALCKVLDISAHGARLETYTELQCGMTIGLRLPKIGQVIARVVWATDFARNETDLNVQWKVPEGALKGLMVRLRYAEVSQSDPASDDLKDLRIMVFYDPPSL